MRSIQTLTCVIETPEPGIIVVRYHDNITVEISDLKRDLELVDYLSGAKEFKRMIVAGEYSDITTEARKHYEAQSRLWQHRIIKEAIVVKSMAHRILAMGYMSVTKTYFPIRVFVSENDAINWLRQ